MLHFSLQDIGKERGNVCSQLNQAAPALFNKPAAYKLVVSVWMKFVTWGTIQHSIHLEQRNLQAFPTCDMI